MAKWKCKEHNQKEWACVKVEDEYYHMKRYKGLEDHNEPKEWKGGWLIPDGKKVKPIKIKWIK